MSVCLGLSPIFCHSTIWPLFVSLDSPPVLVPPPWNHIWSPSNHTLFSGSLPHAVLHFWNIFCSVDPSSSLTLWVLDPLAWGRSPYRVFHKLSGLPSSALFLKKIYLSLSICLDSSLRHEVGGGGLPTLGCLFRAWKRAWHMCLLKQGISEWMTEIPKSSLEAILLLLYDTMINHVFFITITLPDSRLRKRPEIFDLETWFFPKLYL